MNLSSKKLVFVTGKGGVGKSAVAASIAWAEARKGRKVCLFELGSQSFYESFFETRGITYEASEVLPGVHISILTPENCLKEYILHFLRVPKLYDLFFQNKVTKAFLNAAPAVSELSILGKLTAEIRGVNKPEYDVYVIDCYSTGHALALFRAPEGLSFAFNSGNIAEQAHEIAAILKDRELTHYVIVTLPEEMPVTETTELYAQLKKEFNAEISVVANKLLDPPVSRAEQQDLLQSVEEKPVLEFLNYLIFKEDLQAVQLKRLTELAHEFMGVPQILDAQRGQDYIERISKHLETPWTSKNS